MCGIAGVVRFDGGAVAEIDRARGMRARLRHRGPDGEGEWRSRDAILEHTRLSLLDREGGAQPVTTPDGRYGLVFNGEISNHVELRAALDGPFRTRSDAETLLAAFAAWGPECLPRLRGIFAFFVWDSVTRRGFAARDALGVKPLAYAWDGAELLFASEAHVVARARRAPVRVSPEAVLEVLVAPAFSGVARPAFSGVSYLPPGHCMHVGPEGPTPRRWFRFEVGAPGEPPSAAAIREALARAVERACRADAPVGILLSGGLDSSALAALAPRVSGRRRAYTMAFEGMADFDYASSAIVSSDDSPFAELAARSAGLALERVTAPRVELARDLERVAATNDALPAWEQELAQDRLARAAARDVKAVLVGDAADETHFGYHFLLDDAALASPRVLLERFGPVPVRRDVLSDPVGTFAAELRAWIPESDDRGARIAGMTSLVVERWLPRLLHNGDVHGMRAGLEARVPFADTDLLALASRVSPAAGLAAGVEKALLREALRGAVPEAIRTRRKSALPKDQGSGPVLRREAGRLLAEAPAIVTDLVDVPELLAWLEPGQALDERRRAALFRLIGLCHFARHHGIA